jgi:branched-chain amino acid aminotransferase
MTPPDTEGCVRGIMRDQIKKIAESNKFMFYENPLTIHSLISADEVFITNTIQGPQWIRQFQSRIYEQKKVTQFFVEVLNEMIRK